MESKTTKGIVFKTKCQNIFHKIKRKMFHRVWSIAWILHLLISMKQRMNKRYLHSNQWSSKAILKQSEVGMNARPQPRRVQLELILTRLMPLKKQWIMSISRLNFHLLLPTDLWTMLKLIWMTLMESQDQIISFPTRTSVLHMEQ